VGSDVHEVHARSDQVSHIDILAYNSNCVVVPRRWFLRICLFRVFSSMSDDPCRLMTNLAQKIDEPTATALGTSIRASQRSGAGAPVAVQGSRHGTRRAHRSTAQGRGRTRRRPIAGAHRRARSTTRRVRPSHDAHRCVDASGVCVRAAAAVAVATRRASVERDGGAAARAVRRLRMRWTKAARIDRPVALRAPRCDPGHRAFPVPHRSQSALSRKPWRA